MPKKSIEQGSRTPGLPFSSDITEISVKHDLPPTERLLLHLLRSRLNEKQKSCFPSQVTLAEEMGISKRQVIRLVQSVAGKEIISVSKRKMGRRYSNNQNEYKFNFPWNSDKSEPDDTFEGSKVTSMSPIKSDICDKSKVTSETVKSDMGITVKSDMGVTLVTKENKSKNKSSSISQGKNDDDFPQIVFQKDLPEENGNTEIDFRKYYRDDIPEQVDLSQPHSRGRYDLLKYVSPFVGRRDELVRIYGTDFSDSKPEWWQAAFSRFYENVIHYHWDPSSKPSGGFKTAFRRACVSGAMQCFGFQPKSPKQEKREKQEERKRIERNRLAEKKLRKKEKQEKAKARKRMKLYSKLRENSYTYQCMVEIGITNPATDRLDDESFRAYLREWREAGKLKCRDSLLEDLRREIEIQAEAEQF